MPPHLLFVNRPLGGRLAVGARGGHQVPFVDDDDDGTPAFVGVTRDGGIAGSYAFDRIDDYQRDVGGFQMLAGHHH